MSQFKVGDRVKVVENYFNFDKIDIGEIGIVDKLVNRNTDGVYVQFERTNRFMYDKELELIKEDTTMSRLNVGDRLQNGVVISVGSERSVVDGRQFISHEIGCEVKWDTGGYSWDRIDYILGKIIQKAKKEDITMFKKSDLKVGMLIVQRDGDKMLVMPDKNDELFLTNGKTWMELDGYDSNLQRVHMKPLEIVAVYGRFTNAGYLPIPEITNNQSERPLLWKETVVKEMTVEEIAQALGYDVKVVK